MTREELVAAAGAVIHRGSKSFRAASRLFDRTTRERAWLLYCWCRHCDDVCDGQKFGRGQLPRGKVAALKTKTARALDGERTGDLPFDALAQLLSEVAVPRWLIEDHLEGFALDEADWRPRNGDDLIRYCYHAAGSVGSIMAVVMGVPAADGDTLERAADLGIAFQLSNIARDVREDIDAGRCYVPQDWLDEANLSAETLLQQDNRDALVTLVARMVESAAAYERIARLGLPRLPFRSRLAVIAATRIYGAIGREVASLGPAAWDRRVTIGKARKLGFLLPSLADAVALGRRA